MRRGVSESLRIVRQLAGPVPTKMAGNDAVRKGYHATQ